MDGTEYSEELYFEVKITGEKIKFSNQKNAIIDTGNGTISVPSDWLTKSGENTFQLLLPYADKEGRECRIPLRTGLDSYMQDTYITSEKLSKMLKSGLVPELSEGKATPEIVEFNLPEANLWKEKWQTDTMSEPAQNILVSDYWRFNRPYSQLTIKDGRVAFQMAAFKANGEENTVTLRRGFKNPDGSYGEERKTVTVRQLKEMYDVQQRKEIRSQEEKDKFFVMDVRKEQVSDLMTGKNGEPYHFIHLAENCSFIRSASHLHEVKGDEEHYRLYFPLTKKDGTATEISVSRSVYADGQWNKEYKSVTLEKLEEMNRAYVPLQKRRSAEVQKASPEEAEKRQEAEKKEKSTAQKTSPEQETSPKKKSSPRTKKAR